LEEGGTCNLLAKQAKGRLTRGRLKAGKTGIFYRSAKEREQGAISEYKKVEEVQGAGPINVKGSTKSPTS